MKKLKKSTTKGQKSKKPKKSKSTKPEENQSGELIDPHQELFYYGPPPVMKGLYRTNNGYSKDFHPQDLLIQLNNGVSPDEVACSWGISKAMLETWVQNHAELSEAYKVGATAYVAYWKRTLRLGAFGHKHVREKFLFKILDNQVGFNDTLGGHEFADSQGADMVFVDEDGKEF